MSVLFMAAELMGLDEWMGNFLAGGVFL